MVIHNLAIRNSSFYFVNNTVLSTVWEVCTFQPILSTIATHIKSKAQTGIVFDDQATNINTVNLKAHITLWFHMKTLLQQLFPYQPILPIICKDS